MNTDKVIQVRFLKENFNPLPIKSQYKLEYVDVDNYNNYQEELRSVIQLLNIQLVWDGIPTYDDVIMRFKSDSMCLLFYYNDKCIGWNWFNENVTLDWIKNIQDLIVGELYSGGCFVSNTIGHPANAGLYNYNMVSSYLINELNYHTVYGYVDKWNKAALRINYNNGLREFNFLK